MAQNNKTEAEKPAASPAKNETARAPRRRRAPQAKETQPKTAAQTPAAKAEKPARQPAQRTAKAGGRAAKSSPAAAKSGAAKGAAAKSGAAKTTGTAKAGARRGGRSGKQASELALAAAVSKAEKLASAQAAKELQQARQPGRRSRVQRKAPLRLISLGGLNEIGKNMYLYESGNDIVIVDCGLSFPDEEMLGVDLVIPDFTYLERNVDKIRGVFLTHGHEDHIGALPYFLKKFSVPVYGTRLTLGLVEGKLKEHGILNKAQLHVVNPRDTVKAGCMSVEFIRVNHSIPGACALAIYAPAGVVVHTGDFKVDYTPIEGEVIDLGRFGELGNRGVLALLADSTNAERPGATASERKVGESFDGLFARASGKRIIIATFASNIHRVQQIVNVANKYGRKVVVSGRSMVNVVTKAIELGYLKVPAGVLVDIDTLGRYPDGEMVVITTGSQGEPMSALSRMSMGEHRQVSVTANDFIIISATPIPGNEKFVGRVINELMRLGAEVIYERMYEVHTSGHACQEEQKLMMGLTKPKFFVPVHGEYKHMMKNAFTARAMGIPEENIFISDIGRVLETDGVDMKFTGTVPAGAVLVDGLGVGDVGSVVLRDRKLLSADGLIIVVASIDAKTGRILAGPDVVSRGFVYVREAEDLMREAREIARKSIEASTAKGVRDWSAVKQQTRDDLSKFLYGKTKRSPMILPVLQEI